MSTSILALTRHGGRGFVAMVHEHPQSRASPSANMAGMSLLKSAVSLASRVLPASRPALAGKTLLGSLLRAGNVPVRFGSQGKRLFVIQPSHYYDKRFLRLCRYYILLTGIPVFAFITYVNIFIGEAELAEIPEGYVPEHWEYYKHPITRWIVRNITETPESTYEKTLAVLQIESEKVDLRMKHAEARRLMRQRGDGPWFFYESLDEKLISNQHKVYPDD
uniref:NADH dehydrogenase [ubiquinone] 1 beta subcomplex subunit 5, mitochondrial n=1 Tax=Leptobrachium leishanense TaxID=445787 RepID=A0A8C5R2K1_9ANUR